MNIKRILVSYKIVWWQLYFTWLHTKWNLLNETFNINNPLNKGNVSIMYFEKYALYLMYLYDNPAWKNDTKISNK